MSLNVVVLTGRMVRDSELVKKPDTCSRLDCCIAVNSYRKDNDGTLSERADFVNFALFGEYAEKMFQYLRKGTSISLRGHLEQHRWKDKEGKARSCLQVKADSIELMKSPETSAPAPDTGEEQDFEDFSEGTDENYDGIPDMQIPSICEAGGGE